MGAQRRFAPTRKTNVMKHKPWLPYINLITLVVLIFICLFLAIVGGDAWMYGGIGVGLFTGMFPSAVIMFAAIVVIGFITVLLLNFSTSQKGKSGWIILVATFLFIPTAFCLIGMAFFTLPILVSN